MKCFECNGPHNKSQCPNFKTERSEAVLVCSSLLKNSRNENECGNELRIDVLHEDANISDKSEATSDKSETLQMTGMWTVVQLHI